LRHAEHWHPPVPSPPSTGRSSMVSSTPVSDVPGTTFTTTSSRSVPLSATTGACGGGGAPVRTIATADHPRVAARSGSATTGRTRRVYSVHGVSPVTCTVTVGARHSSKCGVGGRGMGGRSTPPTSNTRWVMGTLYPGCKPTSWRETDVACTAPSAAGSTDGAGRPGQPRPLRTWYCPHLLVTRYRENACAEVSRGLGTWMPVR
jgi:hypothetical protein